MSRIVSGNSEEIRKVDLIRPSGEAQPYTGRAFKGAKVEGTFSQGDINDAMQNARIQGRMEGAKEAQQKLMAPVKQSLQNIENLLEDLSRFRRELFKEAEGEVLEVIRILSKKIFGHELSLAEDKQLEFVRKALEVVEQERRVTLVVNPADLKIYTAAKEDFLTKIQGIEKLEIGVAPNQPRGSTKVRTQTEELEVNVESVVDHLLDQIKGESLESPSVNKDEDTVD